MSYHSLGRMGRLKLLRVAPIKWAHSAVLPKPSKVAQNAEKCQIAADEGHAATRSRGGAPLTSTTLDFRDTAAAFRDTPTRDLLRSFFVFQLFRSSLIVKHCTTVSEGGARASYASTMWCVCVCRINIMYYVWLFV